MPGQRSSARMTRKVGAQTLRARSQTFEQGKKHKLTSWAWRLPGGVGGLPPEGWGRRVGSLP